MEVAENVLNTLEHADAVEGAPPFQLVAEQPSSQPPPGSLTKRNRKANHEGSPADWNKFGRDYSSRKPIVEISSYSKEEAIRRRQRERERREMQDRNARFLNHRAEQEAAQRQEEKERAQRERKAWAQAKFDQRQEKIIRAAEERQKRELAYCQLVEKTREKGLLFEKLQARGDELVAAEERQKVEEYKSVLAPAKKIGARDIQHADDLHPSLRALQRVQQQTNIRREAQKMPIAFSPKHVNTGTGGGTSPFSSGIGERIMPGAGSARPESTRGLSAQPARPVSKSCRPSPSRIRTLSVDRATSPVALPGVEILVHELPAAPPTGFQHPVSSDGHAVEPRVPANDPQQDVGAAQNQSIPGYAVDEDVSSHAPVPSPNEAVAEDVTESPVEDQPADVGEQEAEENAEVNGIVTAPEDPGDMSGAGAEEDVTNTQPDNSPQGKEEGEGQEVES